MMMNVNNNSKLFIFEKSPERTTSEKSIHPRYAKDKSVLYLEGDRKYHTDLSCVFDLSIFM